MTQLLEWISAVLRALLTGVERWRASLLGEGQTSAYGDPIVPPPPVEAVAQRTSSERSASHSSEGQASTPDAVVPDVAVAPRVAAVDPVVVVEYWRRALDFVDFKQFGRQRGGKYAVPLERFLLEQVGGRAAAPSESGEAPKGENCQVVLTLWETRGDTLAVEGRRHFLLAVPARLTAGGFLWPRTDVAPVFNDAYLSPRVGASCFALGDSDTANSSLLQELAAMAEDVTRVPGWKSWWDTNIGVVRDLLGARDLIQVEEHLNALRESVDQTPSSARPGTGSRAAEKRESPWKLVAAVYAEASSGANEVRGVYSAASYVLRKHPGRLKLFETLCGPECAEPIGALPDAARHALVAHMDEYDATRRTRTLFPLDDAQRRAVAAVLSLAEGELQAVNGPPGSGKTSMLRAVVASRWVGAVLSNDRCPITVACGATNQSVTNVIEAFGNAPHPDDSLPHARRWIADASSYGAYLPSATVLSDQQRSAELARFVCLKEAKNAGFLYEYWNRANVLDPLRALDYEQQYLTRARLALGDRRISTVEEAISRVRQRLLDVERERAALRHALAAGIPWVEGFRTVSESHALVWSEERRAALNRAVDALKVDATDINAVEAVMDLTWRADAFHWAARYWEGRFLLAQRTRLITRHPLNVEEALRRICMLTPCVVATLHSVPRLCKIDPSLLDAADPVGHVFGLIDLLVIDEAGQASPELSAAAFALARRAAVVGDIKQLAPIWNHSSLSEVAIAAQAGAAEVLNGIVQSRRSVATGSMLAASRLVSRWREPDDLGVTLRYHYRCKPSIIAYCNALSYEGRLIPCTKQGADEPEPALAWVAIETPPKPAGGSWVNMVEVAEIVSWVVERWPCWRGSGKRVQDIVALITPYRPQADRLQSALRDAFARARAADPTLWPTADDVQKVVVGTVHRLQGAERPVVCFSLVEGPEQSGASFVDTDATLLNVAVSRAKQSFIVFANPARLFPAEPVIGGRQLSPVHLLGAHLRCCGQPLYPTRLLLIEAVHKSETLAVMLGKQSAVLATAGALTRLAPGHGVDIEAGFVPRPQLEDNAPSFLLRATKRVEDVPEVVLATDDDRMGELISWQISRLLRPQLSSRKVKRARFGAISRSAVDAALAVAGALDERQVLAEAVREILDCLITERFAPVTRDLQTDYDAQSLSPFSRAGVLAVSDQVADGGRKRFTVGRVQAAILRLLIDRAREVVAAEHRRRIRAVINVDDVQLVGELRTADGRTETASETASRAVEALSGALLVTNSPPVVVREKAQAPHAGTFSLMADAWRRFGMLPWETYEALQALYDGSWLATEGAQEGGERAFDPDDPIEPRLRSGHPPVTPLDRAAPPATVSRLMVSEQCRQVYSMVWQRFELAEVGLFDVTFAEMSLPFDRAFAGGLHVAVHASGCQSERPSGRQDRVALRDDVLGPELDPTRTNDAQSLIDCWRDLAGCRLAFEVVAARQWDMTLDRLLLELEDANIGRPSTISRALRSLVNKALIELPAGRGAVRITTRGFAAAFALEQQEPELSAPEFSASLDAQLDAIQTGVRGPRDVLGALAHHFVPADRVDAISARVWDSLAELELAMDEAAKGHPSGGLVAPGPDTRNAAEPLAEADAAVMPRDQLDADDAASSEESARVASEATQRRDSQPHPSIPDSETLL